ncbi:MAG: hypothetical protein B6D56_05845 [Candidatus Omnitrophica bacterium 4484_70.1]|nr:MAG: hypothetical protein B6D56_05845 [Candidatus Omnitrophica bacterium 4484_70.1]
MKNKFLLKIGIILCLVGIVFFSIYPPLYERFTAKDSYYSHGFLVPFICLFLIWRKRKVIKNLFPPYPCKQGLILLICGLLLHSISFFLKFNFGSYIALVIVLLGISLYLLGRKITRQLLFPIFFLIFMLPLPKVLIIGISFKMKMIVAKASSLILNIVIPNVQRGSTIYLPNDSLMIGDPCSGLRSLISLLTLGTLATQFISGGKGKKLFLLALTVPIALISNIIRIILLLIVTYVYGKKVALGFFHDLSGFLTFAFAFLCLWAIVKVLKCLPLVENS